MRSPVVWKSDLNGYLREWNKAGAIVFENMPDGTRIPKRGDNIIVALANARGFS
jgi:hypothetical protein